MRKFTNNLNFGWPQNWSKFVLKANLPSGHLVQKIYSQSIKK